MLYSLFEKYMTFVSTLHGLAVLTGIDFARLLTLMGQCLSDDGIDAHVQRFADFIAAETPAPVGILSDEGV